MTQASVTNSPNPAADTPQMGHLRKWTDYFTFSTDHKVAAKFLLTSLPTKANYDQLLIEVQTDKYKSISI